MPFSLSGVSKSYGATKVLESIELSLDEKSMLVILGPSGCGKTSLLKIIAGLDSSFEGTRSGFSECRFSFAFQEPRLLPWLSISENVLFALSGAGLDRTEALARARRLFGLAGLAGYENFRPAQLSGGMRQRASLVRAFAFPATYLLLDEAFQSVDLRLKHELMRLFLDLRALADTGALLVTHDPDEALYLADRVVILSERPGKIIDDFPIRVERRDRNPGSGALAEFEARIYAGILGDR